MKLLLITIQLLLIVTCSKAQDLTLPQGECRIYLQSGKIIRPVILWRIDTLKVEYVRNGNLADKKIADILKIETPRCFLTFDEKNHMVKNNHDRIILYPQDTLWGSILKINESTFTFLPAGSDVNEKIKRKNVINILQSDESPVFPGNKTTEVPKPETVPLVDRIVVAMDSTRINREPLGMKKSEIKKQDSISVIPEYISVPVISDYDSVQVKAGKENIKSGLMNNSYYYQSYQRGISDAIKDYKGRGWANGGFWLGITFGSPFLTLSAANSHPVCNVIPQGVDETLYRNGYENQIVKTRTKKAAGGAAAAKGLLVTVVFIVVVLAL